MDVCERACVFPSLFYNPAPPVTQSGSCGAAGEEEGRLGDRLRYSPVLSGGRLPSDQAHVDVYRYTTTEKPTSNCSSPVPVGSVVGRPSLVEAALRQGLLLVEDKLLETHLHLRTGHGA